MYIEWRTIGLKILSEDFDTEKIQCPECGESHVDYMFAVNLESNVGYLSVWCNSCLRGIQFSRVAAPEGMKKIDMYDEKETEEYIPNFKLIHPN